MRDLLYLKDDQIKDFIEQIFYAYRETYSDPKKVLKKYSFGTAHHRAIHLIERHEGLTVSDLLRKLKITKQSLSRVLSQLVKEGFIIVSTGLDKRTKTLSLTQEGLNLEKQLSTIQINQIKKSISKFNHEDINGFKKILFEMIEVDNKKYFNI